MACAAGLMSSEWKPGLRRRRLREWVVAVSVSLAVQALLFLSLVHSPVDLGVQSGGFTNVSLLPLDALAMSEPTQAQTAQQSPAAKLESEETAEPPAAPDEGTAPSAAGLPIDAPPGAAEPKAPSAPEVDPAAKEAQMASVAAFVAEAAEAQAGQPGENCKIAEWLTGALRNNAEIEMAVALVPRGSRSVANALMLWNGVWVQPVGTAQEGVASLKYAIVAGVRSAPPACLEQTVRGPLLIPVGAEQDTLMLAIGSGEWRWADLLEEPEPPGTNIPPS